MKKKIRAFHSNKKKLISFLKRRFCIYLDTKIFCHFSMSFADILDNFPGSGAGAGNNSSYTESPFVSFDIEDVERLECQEIFLSIDSCIKKFFLEKDIVFATIEDSDNQDEIRLLSHFCIQERLRVILELDNIKSNYSCMRYLLWSLLNSNALWIDILLINLIETKYFSLEIIRNTQLDNITGPNGKVDLGILKFSLINYLTKLLRVTKRNYTQMIRLKNYLCMNSPEMSIDNFEDLNLLSPCNKLKQLCLKHKPSREILSEYFLWLF